MSMNNPYLLQDFSWNSFAMCASQLYHPQRGITQGKLAYEMMGYVSQKKEKVTAAHHVDQGVGVKREHSMKKRN